MNIKTVDRQIEDGQRPLQLPVAGSQFILPDHYLIMFLQN